MCGFVPYLYCLFVFFVFFGGGFFHDVSVVYYSPAFIGCCVSRMIQWNNFINLFFNIKSRQLVLWEISFVIKENHSDNYDVVFDKEKKSLKSVQPVVKVCRVWINLKWNSWWQDQNLTACFVFMKVCVASKCLSLVTLPFAVKQRGMVAESRRKQQ